MTEYKRDADGKFGSGRASSEKNYHSGEADRHENEAARYRQKGQHGFAAQSQRKAEHHRNQAERFGKDCLPDGLTGHAARDARIAAARTRR